jgi:hypothetical protein
VFGPTAPDVPRLHVPKKKEKKIIIARSIAVSNSANNSHQAALYLDVNTAQCIEPHSLLSPAFTEIQVRDGRVSWSTPPSIRRFSELFLDACIEFYSSTKRRGY